MGTWNVAGIGLDVLDTFIEQLSDNYMWDIVTLQEGIRQTEGIESEFGHLLFTSAHLVGNLRCPAILVNDRWKGLVDVSFVYTKRQWLP